MQEKNSEGRSIDSYCGKCRQSSDHTIMKMEEETITKVRCKTCGGTHKFRSPEEEAKIRKPRIRRDTGENATAEMVWQAGLEKAKGKEREYSMTEQYRIGDIVNHRTFGKGVVLRLYINKCGMLFKDGEKLMASTN